MPHDVLPPLDIQTETLTRDQQPGGRMLLGIALIAFAGISLSWLAHQPPTESAMFPQGPHGPGGAQVALAGLRQAR